jgi:signal transduction histidine kinase
MALLAHQIRTPLSTINALAQSLMRRADRMSSNDVQLRAEKIWRSSVDLNGLIDTIMSYTRASAGGISLKLIQFDLETFIRRICQEQGNQQPERTFTIDIKDIPSTFVGDAVLLEQALVIVLSNAMKYSPPEQPIRVTVDTAEGFIRIIVEDEGIGVSEWDLPFLMQPFFRGRNAKELPGTGLGLSLAWHILKLHGGNLQIHSQEGRGTAVTIKLPEKIVPETNADPD